MSMCSNCKAYGSMVDDNVVMPCTNCARESGYVWNGVRCLGAQGNGEVTPWELARIYFELLQTQHHTTHENNLSILPEESKAYYQGFVNGG